MNRPKPLNSDLHADGPSRRGFLGSVSTLTVAAATSRSAAADEGTAGDPNQLAHLLPTAEIGKLQVSRLILGGNPIYGHSHFNRLYSQHLREYHTPERVVSLVRDCAKAGINTWQNSYTLRTVSDVLRCREEGIPFHWFLLGKGDWVSNPSIIETAAKNQPDGIAPHGSSAERLHREGRLNILRDMLKRIRQTGCLVGLSAHNPAVIEIAEDQGWDVDYYMCCAYYHNRPQDEVTEMLGERPMGEVYLRSDRDRMMTIVGNASKPCLVYKVLAAGREVLSSRGIQDAFKFALDKMKPNDAMIVGMFQEFGDQVAMNARIVRQLCQT
jgi:hypothetical protein